MSAPLHVYLGSGVYYRLESGEQRFSHVTAASRHPDPAVENPIVALSVHMLSGDDAGGQPLRRVENVEFGDECGQYHFRHDGSRPDPQAETGPIYVPDHQQAESGSGEAPPAPHLEASTPAGDGPTNPSSNPPAV